MTYQFTIPGKLPGLNEIIEANRNNRFAGAKQKRDVQFLIKLVARNLPVLKEPVKIEYLWIEPNKRRDWDNIRAGAKFIRDSLVELGKLKNDGWANICYEHSDYAVDKDNPRVEVTITDQNFED